MTRTKIDHDPDDNQIPPWLTVAGAAARLTLSTSTVLRHIHSGALRAVRIGGVYRVSEADLAVYIEARYVRLPGAGQSSSTRRNAPGRRAATARSFDFLREGAIR